MFPPRCAAIWQSSAHASVPGANAFATLRRFGQHACKALAHRADGLFCDDCYPSPYPWPGPVWVRPSFSPDKKRRIADAVGPYTFGFHLAPNAVESGPIKTITRGSVTCGNRPLLSWRFAQPPFQRAWTTICSAALLARLVAQWLLMRSAATLLPVRLSAVPVAWFATIWAFANKPKYAGHVRPAALKDVKTTRAQRPGGFFMPAWWMAPRKDSNV